MAYNHPWPPESNNKKYQVNNLHQAMQYDAYGQPALRTIGVSGDSTISAGTDAFGRQKVSQPYTLFDAQLRYSKRTDLFDEQLTGAGSTTYQINESTLDLEVTDASGDKVTRESKYVFPYQPGKSLQILATFVMNEGKTGLSQCVGYYNDSNGIFFANIDGVNYFVKRSFISGTVVETKVAQSDWNIETLDGNSVSGIDIDITKAQILFMDLEWLGVGQVRTGFVVDGNFYYCHVFKHANVISSVYMTTAVLPIRYEIENTSATASASTMKQICSTVISEGGYNQNTPINFVSNGVNGQNLTTKGSEYPLISIRLNSSRLDSVVVIRKLEMLILSNQNVLFKILKNPTITLNGTSWQTHTNGIVDYVLHDINSGGGNVPDTFSGGVEVTGGWLSTDSGTAGLDSNLIIQLGRFLDGTSDIYTVVASPANNGVNVSALLGWGELI